MPLLRESFEGDVLLVWDDIHDISPETDNTVFRESVTKLETTLSEDGHNLQVIATARTGHRDVLPGNHERSGSSLWGPFVIEKLEPLGETHLAALVENALAEYDVTADEAVREAFLEKALDADPSPVYVTSVVGRAAGSELSIGDVEALPDDALEFWEDQYAEIRESPDKRRFGLWAVAFLKDIGVPVYESLLEGVYEHVLGRESADFAPWAERLEREQWLVRPADSDRYVVHDVKAEAIAESTTEPRRLKSFSEFLLTDAEWYIPKGADDIERTLHGRFALFAEEQDSGRTQRLAEKHYRRILEEIDREDVIAHNNYAVLLKSLDRPEEAEHHYQRAIDIDPPIAEAHVNYALLLESLDRLKEAEHHYQRAIDINPDYAKAHYSYAFLLKSLDRFEDAEAHYRKAIDINPDYAEAHYRYANLLKSMDRPDDAEHYYQQAIDINPDYAKAHFNYGVLLIELERLEEAHSHIEESVGLWLDRDNIRNVLNDLQTLVRLCERRRKHEEAVDRCEQALALLEEAAESTTEEYERGTRALYAILDGRDPKSTIEESYYHGLGHVLESDPATAIRLCKNAWNRRTETDEDLASGFAVGAGLILAAHGELFDLDGIEANPSEILEAVDPEVLETRAQIALYERLTAGTTETTPEDLRDLAETDEEFAEDEILRLEALACATLLEVLADTDDSGEE